MRLLGVIMLVIFISACHTTKSVPRPVADSDPQPTFAGPTPLHRIVSQPDDQPPDTLIGKGVRDATIFAEVIIDSTGTPRLDKITGIVFQYETSKGTVEERSFGSAFQPIPDSLVTKITPWTREYVSRIETEKQNENTSVRALSHTIRIPVRGREK